MTTTPDPPPCGVQHPTFTALRCDLPVGHDGDHNMRYQNVIARGEPRRTIYRGKR